MKYGLCATHEKRIILVRLRSRSRPDRVPVAFVTLLAVFDHVQTQLTDARTEYMVPERNADALRHGSGLIERRQDGLRVGSQTGTGVDKHVVAVFTCTCNSINLYCLRSQKNATNIRGLIWLSRFYIGTDDFYH